MLPTMLRPVRIALLSLALLIQGLGNAWALHPAMALAPAPMSDAVVADTEAPPCHGGADAATMHEQQATADRGASPCCGDDCRCPDGCSGAAALMPSPEPAEGRPMPVVVAQAAAPDVLPAHPLRLLRPPTSAVR